MAEVTRRVCDVFGSGGAERMELTLKYVDRPDVAVPVWKRDLCERGVKRLMKFIDRGCSKPTEKVDLTGIMAQVTKEENGNG